MVLKNPKVFPGPKLLVSYIDFLRRHQCVSEATVVIRIKFVRPFLNSIRKIALPSRLFRLSAKEIHDYIIKTAKPLHRASKKHLVSSIRSFLRFGHIQGYLKRDLVAAVPIIATRKLDRVPLGIPWKSVQQLLRMPDKKTHSGRRDYAVLLLLARYGVRIGQVTTLKLCDIHWQEGVICFPACKGGEPLRLPLFKEVAAGLLAYIKEDRKDLSFPQLFLTIKEPQRPLSLNNHFYTSLEKHYRKAGFQFPSKGSRVIRHAFATRLVEKRTPIKAIADLLGHKWIDTTFIYIKVDVEGLRVLAREWPGVVQ